MPVYSDRDFHRQQGLSQSDIEKSPSVEIEREHGDVSYQPSSVDLHLGEDFLFMEGQKRPVHVDAEGTYPDYHYEHCPDDVIVRPQEFVLATTEESVSLDDSVVGYLWGRSSVGRLGLFVHNAGLVDAGFGPGELTLEIFNASPNPIVIKSGMRVVQLSVHELQSDAKVDYSAKGDSKYQNQESVKESRLWEDFDTSSINSSHETNEWGDFQ